MRQLMTEGKTFAGICDIVRVEYDVRRHVLEQEVLKLAGEHLDQGLIAIACHFNSSKQDFL